MVDIAERTIGIFRVGGSLHAWDNICPHQGGPVCQGTILPRVVEKLAADSKASTGFAFDSGDLHIVCPWHGFEFTISTGRHAGGGPHHLRKVNVDESEGEVYANLS